jgi:hypothetical protein
MEKCFTLLTSPYFAGEPWEKHFIHPIFNKSGKIVKPSYLAEQQELEKSFSAIWRRA